MAFKMGMTRKMVRTMLMIRMMQGMKMMMETLIAVTMLLMLVMLMMIETRTMRTMLIMVLVMKMGPRTRAACRLTSCCYFAKTELWCDPYIKGLRMRIRFMMKKKENDGVDDDEAYRR